MADPTSNDDSNSFGVAPPAPDPNDPNWSWDYNWLNPYGNYIANLPNLMPGPLAPNAPSWYFPNSNGSVGSTVAPGSWTIPVADTVSGGNGGDLVGGAGNDADTARAHEFDKFYTPAGSLLAGDPAHIDAVAPAPVSPMGSMVGRDPVHPFVRALVSDGEFVTLPDGSQVPDEYSWTGYLMSPSTDLGPVAAAGRRTGENYVTLSSEPNRAALASPYLAYSLGIHLGHGGTFDYQREGNFIDGYRQHPQFRDVSNVNVGLFGQQAGLSLDDVLLAAGAYARMFSSNANADKPYGLATENMEMIKAGYDLGQSGVFDPSHIPQGGG